jgi:hypothetical protein
MYRLLNNVYQKTLPAGSCYSVGLGGHITGGGYGVLSRLYGLSIDYLTAVDIVVGDRAQGARMITKCSRNHESELFWAVRGGGGGQFGIITRYYFSLAGLPDSPAYIYIHSFGCDWRPEPKRKSFWPWRRSQPNPLISESQFSDFFNCFQNHYTAQAESTWNVFGIFHGNHMDAGNLSVSSIVVYDPKVHAKQANFEQELFNQYRQRQAALTKIIPNRSQDFAWKGHPYVPSIRALGCNAQGDLRRYTYLEGMQELNASGPNRYGKYKSAYHTQTLTPAMIAAAYKGLTQTVRDSQGTIVDMQNSLIQFDAYGGKINTLSPEATAIPQRNSILKLQYQSYWDTNLAPGEHNEDSERLQAAHVNWLNGMYENIYGASGGVPKGPGTEGCYFNYPDIDIGSTEAGTPDLEQALELYFLGNLPRLKQVAATYNPDGWFQNSQSLSNVTRV